MNLLMLEVESVLISLCIRFRQQLIIPGVGLGILSFYIHSRFLHKKCAFGLIRKVPPSTPLFVY